MTVTTCVCPSCGQRLTVSPAAPQRLTCPKCLGRVENPTGWLPGSPRPVIPVEVEVERDASTARIGGTVLTIVLSIGVIVTLFALDKKHPLQILVAILILAALAWATIVIGSTHKRLAVAQPHSRSPIVSTLIGCGLAVLVVGLLMFGLCAAAAVFISIDGMH